VVGFVQEVQMLVPIRRRLPQVGLYVVLALLALPALAAAQTGATPVETGLQRLVAMCVRAVPFASTLGIMGAAVVIASGHHDATTKALRIGIAVAVGLGAQAFVSYFM
jgi:hypothetical protein